MSEKFKPSFDHYQQLVKRITYYTSLFIGSFSVIVITVLLNQDTTFSTYVQIIFLLYLFSVLVMVLIGNIIWNKVDDVILRIEGFFSDLNGAFEHLKIMREKYYKLLETQEKSEYLNLNIAGLKDLIKNLEGQVSEAEQVVEKMSSYTLPSLNTRWTKSFNWNIFISTGLLFIGIIFIVMKI